MHRSLRVWRPLIAAGALVAALAVLPAGASAATSTINCAGKISVGTPDEINEHPVTHDFRCTEKITGFLLISSKDVDYFDAETQVFEKDGKTIVASDAFACSGELPSAGLWCPGTYGGANRRVVGSFGLGEDPCKGGTHRERAMVAVLDSKGNIAGPFDLGKVKGCPKAKKAKKSSHHR
jgi:membrane-bound inhibitor of C-type lysozyme